MKRRIYVDGIFDLFHKGHVIHFKDIKELDNEDNYLIVGIISDEDAKDYKRLPIYDQENRKILVESCRYVDEIIENAPLIVDQKFIEDNKIDLVCHGFLNKNDVNKQEKFFEIPKKMNKFRAVNYHTGISTTDIIKKIKENY